MQPFAVRRVRIRVETPCGAPTSVVMFVTEDADLRAAAERVLTGEGFEVVAAAHAGHALLACLAGRHVDVLVTELSMRDMTGTRLARRVRRYYPDLPVIYLAKAGSAAGEGILVRPFTRDELIGHLKGALASARSPITAAEGPSPAS